MLRPIYLDLLDVFLPLAASFGALVGGRFLECAPRWFFRLAVGLAVAIVLVLGITYFTPIRDDVSDAFWHVGGVTTVACVLAMVLLGVVWASHGRSTSTGFLRTVAGLVALIVVLNSGGRLWWRTINTAAWENAPDAVGCLRQSSGWTCSPAAATMLLHHHGIATTEGEMAYLAGTSYLGTDVPSIADALKAKAAPKFVVRVIKADYDACIQITGPFLACIDVPGLGGHAVLVLRVGPDSLELVDPRFGQPQTIARADMEPQWQGKIVRLKAAE